MMVTGVGVLMISCATPQTPPAPSRKTYRLKRPGKADRSQSRGLSMMDGCQISRTDAFLNLLRKPYETIATSRGVLPSSRKPKRVPAKPGPISGRGSIWRLTPRPPRPVGAPSLRLLCRLAAAEVLLLTLCLAATPARLALIADHVQLPQRLATGDDAICEYGYRHTIDRLTVFRSRLSVQELARSDRVSAGAASG